MPTPIQPNDSWAWPCRQADTGTVNLCAECAPKVREAAGSGREVALCASCSVAAEHATRIPRMPMPLPCTAIAPPPHTQAGARCEREQHADGNHKLAARDGKPGAVWK